MAALGSFSPKRTSRLFVVLGDLFTGVLIAFWGSGAWLVSLLLKGRNLPAGVLLPVWLLLAFGAFVVLHRAGRVRLWISVSTTALVLLATAAVVVGWA